MVEAIAFYILAALAVLGGVIMVTRKNPLSGAFALVLSMVAIAGIFAMLHAEFVFILQVLLYAGAIMVLVIFTIMLLNLSPEELQEAPVGRLRTLITLAAAATGFFAFTAVLRTMGETAGHLPGGFGNVAEVGRLMLGTYLYPFEVISILLLVAVVGVVILAKKVI